MNFCGYDEDGRRTDAHLLTGPLYHAAPLAFSVAVPFAYGVRLVIMDHWDATESLQLIERHGITHTHMVPTMFHRLVALPGETKELYDTSSLRFIIHGAAPCPVPIKQRLIEWLGPDRGRVLRRHRRARHARGLEDVARTPRHGRADRWRPGW